MVLQNDPEMAVFLRLNFPNAFILHLFQNSNPCNERFRTEFARSVDVAAAVSENCAKWNANYFGGEVGVFYNSVDADRFSPAPSPPAGPPVINFVGRTDRQKAPDLLLAPRSYSRKGQCIFSSRSWDHASMAGLNRTPTKRSWRRLRKTWITAESLLSVPVSSVAIGCRVSYKRLIFTWCRPVGMILVRW